MTKPPTKIVRSALWRRVLFVLACLQVLAPAAAAVADGVGVDQRAAYAHIESETGSGCVVVHPHDCVLCATATTPMARPASTGILLPEGLLGLRLPKALNAPKECRATTRAASRAPPLVLS